jgi:hypothetical protein
MPRFGDTDGRRPIGAAAFRGAADGATNADDGCTVGAASPPAEGNATATVAVGAGNAAAAGADAGAERLRSGNTSRAATAAFGGRTSVALTAGDADAGNSVFINRTGGFAAGATAGADVVDAAEAAADGTVTDGAAVGVLTEVGAVDAVKGASRGAPAPAGIAKVTDARGTYPTRLP